MFNRGTLVNVRALLLAVLVALAFGGAAIFIKLLVLQAYDVNAGFVVYVPAIALAAWLRGLLSGMLVTLLGGLTDAYLFMAPLGALAMDDPEDQVRLAFYLLGGTTVSILFDRLRVTRDRARADAAERRRLLEAEAATRQRLTELLDADRRASELREAFNSIVSHELRTPITAIYAGAKLLARSDRTLDEATRLDLARDMELEAERLFRLVEDLLVLARTERGSIELGDEPVLLSHVAERVVRSEEARWPSARFTFRAAGASGAVRGDDTYIEQVLRNLLSNAAKYSPVEGEIEVVVDQLEEGVRVRVLDEGAGIQVDEANRLFELYYRSATTAKKAGGAGIGLFVCRTLIEAMGGRIWAARRDERGSEFGFVLPPYVDEADSSVRTPATE
jgi:K+-sensing histidine kinase KdpD